MRSRNVISHVILLFSRDCHNYDRHNIVSRIKLKRAMAYANNVFSCLLCDIFLRPSEAGGIHVFGKADKLPDVFLLDSKLCGPWHRRLETIHSRNAVRCRRKSKALDSKQ